MVKVYRTNPDSIRILNGITAPYDMNHTEARQLIADLMAALDEPAKVDVTTQAYQEFKEPEDLERFVNLYHIAKQRGMIK